MQTTSAISTESDRKLSRGPSCVHTGAGLRERASPLSILGASCGERTRPSSSVAKCQTHLIHSVAGILDPASLYCVSRRRSPAV